MYVFHEILWLSHSYSDCVVGEIVCTERACEPELLVDSDGRFNVMTTVLFTAPHTMP